MSAPQPPHPQQQGPPPVPPSKPVLSSPGAYMANFTSSTTIAPPTAGIHSVNKSHPAVAGEKPAIAARPIPPPTLPKYSASFSKADRDRNEFAGKIDRAEREKVCIGFLLCCSLFKWNCSRACPRMKKKSILFVVYHMPMKYIILVWMNSFDSFYMCINSSFCYLFMSQSHPFFNKNV